MPEGDTIYRTAMTLRGAVEGAIVDSLQCREQSLGADSLRNRRITSIEARGKHLLMHFDDCQVLHSHMGMTGSWHLYHKGEAWQKPARQAAISFEANNTVAVCFSPKTLELLSATAYRRHRYLQQLGPDVLAGVLDESEVLRRFRLHDRTPIGEAVLNQTILCGIGNVYKSEVLFVARVDPFIRVAEIGDEHLREIVSIARQLMKKNLVGYPRRTQFTGKPQRHWVYGRKGKPCFECGGLIDMKRQGDLGRSTYWCPACQPSGAR